VGKTTTAAALALAAARAGRRACVVTIDPARRLADALGAEEITNSPHRIDGPWAGELSAVMLDAKGTFDDLIERYARDPEQSKRILDNRLYRNLVSALSGTQEYMATEKLFELDASGRFDLVVVDTPPTHHALDFLDAPSRLTGFLDNRVFRVLLTPGRSYMKAMNAASQVLLRTIGKVAGSEIVEDTVAFFQAFEGMEEGFRERAARVEQLLAAEGTGFIVVASPRRDSIEEAEFFTGKLNEGRHVVDALVVNRVHPDFGPPLAPDAGVGGAGSSAWEVLGANLAEMATVVRRERSYLASLTAAVAPAPVVLVPLLEDDVHDLAGLDGVVRHLVGGTLPLPGGQGDSRQ
jgi:anion-transporting  ArsA/GET3 family ATPase